MRIFKQLAFILLIGSGFYSHAQKTACIYLSGRGMDDTVAWQFYCTAGRNSGKWTTIPVPSQWELHGFGKYNYGQDKDEDRGRESGLYKYAFEVPAEWKKKKVNIVFEGAMTDTEVKINGVKAGPIHQGAFYRFRYDIGRLLKPGQSNLLEVKVDKHSANESVNEAERRSDFWIFGGIFRPVYLEALPRENIARLALDARADGGLGLDVFLDGMKQATEVKARVLDLDGAPVATPFSGPVRKGQKQVHLNSVIENIKTWTPEFPNRYRVRVQLLKGTAVLHEVTETFGFRTVALRPHDGLYVNGVKIKFKGVNRHSFWPTSGRTTSRALSIADVNMMKDMNMNAVRMSHYPPDVHFLDVCDSLGLFVLDELAGWQTAYDTAAGSKLAREMIERDINHPCIVVWDNGNEGGWNTGLDHWFDELDPQKRPLIHPWEVFRHTDTQHYKDYDYGTGTHQHGNRIVFPTEFLHGLYDGGHGAGLEDFWKLMWSNPLSAGGFLWDFADEAVVRTDRDGVLDTDGNHAADGIVGPYHEKEGSYFAIKEIWAPVFFERRYITADFNGEFTIENRYHFTNSDRCTFRYKVVKLPAPHGEKAVEVEAGVAPSPAVAPGHRGVLKVPVSEHFFEGDVLYITATDPFGRHIHTWSWPIHAPAEMAAEITTAAYSASIAVEEDAQYITARTGDLAVSFSKSSGQLAAVKNRRGAISLHNGPVLCEGDTKAGEVKKYFDGKNLVIDVSSEGNIKKFTWTLFPSGWVKLDLAYTPAAYHSTFMGVSFSYPEEKVTGMRWAGYGPYRVWKNRLKGNTFNVWHKDYNNTITGEKDFIYPEFKGYHKGLYWVTVETTEQPFTVVCADDDVFLRMFTPAPPVHANNRNTAPPFPPGDISFMHGIAPIGTKFKGAEQLGPMGQKNTLVTYGRKQLTLYFDFRGEKK